MFCGDGVEKTWLRENAAKKAYVLVLGIFDKVHKDKPICGDI